METLLTLFFSDNTDLPQGIRIKQVDAFHTGSLDSGQQVICRAGLLNLSGTPISVNLSKARVWRSEMALLGSDFSRSAIQSAWQSAAGVCQQEKKVRHSQQLAGEIVSQRIGRELQLLSRSTQRFDLDCAGKAAGGLIGLGPGLTPAGDDILIGFMAGLWAVSKANQSQRQFTRQFGEILGNISTQTNLISRTYLMHAIREQFSSILWALAQSICRGVDVETIRCAAGTVFQSGHTSGLDSVSGLLAGLAAWNSDLPLEFSFD